MNGNCTTCNVEPECDYPYKPCDCCNYRKFRPKATSASSAQVAFPASTLSRAGGAVCTECNGAGGWEKEFSSTNGGWVTCPKCQPLRGDPK